MTCFTSLEEAIREIFGAERRIKVRRAVSGGDINEAYALTLDDGTSVFLKQNKVAALSNFQAEAAGLQAIERTGKIRTPGVLGCGTDPSGVSFLLLAFIRPGTPISGYWEVFGRELAAMHGTLSENGKAVQCGGLGQGRHRRFPEPVHSMRKDMLHGSVPGRFGAQERLG